jgi:putative membrane protein
MMKKYVALSVSFIAGLILSGIHPHDYFTWILEVFPGIIGACILVFTFHKFRFSDLTYILILVHCYILFIGGHYTYAEVPLFDWIRDFFHQSRNNYDKVGHFAQGFVPAMIVREIFIRQEVVKKGVWLSLLTVCVCLSISVFYEFLEWFVAVVSGQSADAFLGTQGYSWDTQSDMLYALIGAVCMIVFLSHVHDKQIEKIKAQELLDKTKKAAPNRME